MSKIHLRASVLALGVALISPSGAQAQAVQVGGLTCNTAARVGLVVGSRQRMTCIFHSNSKAHRYFGTITRVGLDLGVTGGGRLFWAVFAPTSQLGPRALRGTYVGASGNASVGAGLGANVLVGGSRRSISLQPLSVEGLFGVNLAAGVAGLRLH
jgi:hypothetical protein